MSKTLYNALDILERSTGENLSSLESKYCRNLFKILLIGKGKDKVVRYIQEVLKFQNITYLNSVEAAEDVLRSKKPFDLILSDYRFDFYKKTGYHLSEYLSSSKTEIPHMIIDEYNDIEMRELKKLKILLLPKPFNIDKLKIVINSFYLKKLDDLCSI